MLRRSWIAAAVVRAPVTAVATSFAEREGGRWEAWLDPRTARPTLVQGSGLSTIGDDAGAYAYAGGAPACGLDGAHVNVECYGCAAQPLAVRDTVAEAASRQGPAT